MERLAILMDLKRFFTDEVYEKDGFVVLRDEEFSHAVKVTRHKVGYKLIVCNNSDFDYYCTVLAIERDRLVARIDEKEINDAETKTPVTLYIGINKDLDTAVQKAVELGVRRIVPFTSSHGNFDAVNGTRMEKIVLESAKQCGRSVLPTFCPVVSLQQAIDEAKDGDVYFFYEHERNNKVFDQPIGKDKVGVFIGPEGGFSEEERDSFLRLGIRPVSLGKRILRVSTAVVSALTLVNLKTGEL